METDKHWYANDAFWQISYDFLFPAERLEAADQEIEAILQLVGHRVENALDLCCGPARMACALARRGIQVTGVDASSFLLEKARERAARASCALAEAPATGALEFVRDDMRTFRRPEAFDLAINVFTSFGYFEDPRDNQAVLENLFVSLRPGGTLVMEMQSKERLARVFLPSSVHELADGRVWVCARRICDGWQQVENIDYYLQGGSYETFALRHYVYSGQELRRMLLDAGFAQVSIYGGYDGSPFDAAQRMVAVARR